MLPYVVLALLALVAFLAAANLQSVRPACVQPKRRPAPAMATATATAKAGGADEALRARIRDRYVAARFPGVARSAADLIKIDRVIPAARLFFEEEQPDRALELLQLAREQCPTCEPVRLAELEIAFLVHDHALFNERARDFHRNMPASAAWSEVARLGRALSPGEPLFGEARGPKGTEHFGPWPDMPNWIRASWDLTAEVLACDFHRIMKTRASAKAPAARMPAAEEIAS